VDFHFRPQVCRSSRGVELNSYSKAKITSELCSPKSNAVSKLCYRFTSKLLYVDPIVLDNLAHNAFTTTTEAGEYGLESAVELTC